MDGISLQTLEQLRKIQTELSESRCFIQKQSSELCYANLLHDSAEGSLWLKNQTFSLYGWAANNSFIYLLFGILGETSPQNILNQNLLFNICKKGKMKK